MIQSAKSSSVNKFKAIASIADTDAHIQDSQPTHEMKFPDNSQIISNQIP